MIHPAAVPFQVPAQPPGPDTVALVATPGGLATVQAVSTIVLAVAVLVVLLAVVLLLFQLRILTRSVTSVARRLESDSQPVLERARGVAENVEFITAAVRTDVEKLNQSISGLNERLREASLNMEERIQDFSALVEVLQSEAEDLALDTAAAVRGVREGTRSLAGPERPDHPADDDAETVPSTDPESDVRAE